MAFLFMLIITLILGLIAVVLNARPSKTRKLKDNRHRKQK
jgi:F0F1-type ATP synthase assembly protein I